MDLVALGLDLALMVLAIIVAGLIMYFGEDTPVLEQAGKGYGQ